MSYIRRLAVGMAVTIGVAVAGIVYYRVGHDHLFDLATNAHSGPFSVIIGRLDVMAPIALAIILLGTWAWVIFGGVQRKRRREVVRR